MKAFFAKEEFAFIFERCFRGASENYRKDKLKCYRGILVNSAIAAQLKHDEQEFFLYIVDKLSTLHLSILSFMAERRQYLEAREIPISSINGGFSQFFPVAMQGVPTEIIQIAFGDLYDSGFTRTNKTIFTTMTSGQGLDLLGDRLTETGKSFVSFCTSPALGSQP